MKFYFEAEQFLSDNRKGSLKNRIFNHPKLANSPKHIYAVVYSTLKYKDHIQVVIRKSKIKDSLPKKLKISDNLLILVVHDLIFSAKGRIQSGKHPIKDAILKHKTRLQAEMTKLKLKLKVKSVDELPTKGVDEDETPIRWCRINTIKTTEKEFFEKNQFFAKLQPVSQLSQLTGPGMIYHDDYIPQLFGIHPKEKLTSTQAYLNGEVIIQDRASCFPAVILNNDPKDVHTQVIDACAAPGNKTTHSASYVLQHQLSDGVVYAFERDNHRVKTLKIMSEKATGKKHADLIQVTHADFTTTKPEDFPDVTGMLVDPSCSGSGIFGRALEDNNEQENEEVDTERLNKLASFQFTIMKHALSFPHARKVVYSTCSIHPHENERVVVDLLMDPQVKAQGWTLASRDVVIPSWPRRGWEQEFTAICNDDAEQCREMAGGCVRSVPKEDGGIGFFAACFVKKTE